MEAWEIAQLAAAAAAEKKGYDVLILDISPVSLIADYFVIASASNKIQMAAIADNVEQRLAEQGESILHREDEAKLLGSYLTTVPWWYMFSVKKPASSMLWNGCGVMHRYIDSKT